MAATVPDRGLGPPPMCSDGRVDGDAPEPIEVELTSHEPRPPGGRRRREPLASEPTDDEPAGDTPSTRPASARAHQLVTAGVVGVLALALGLVVGRSTSSDTSADDAPAAPTTTVPEPFETLPIVGEEIGGAEFDVPEEASTSRPSSTTTEPDRPTTAPVGIDERVRGVPVRLVGVELGGDLVEADLASGIRTDFGVRRLVSDGSPLVVGPDWVAASANGRARVIRSDGTDTSVDVLGDWWSLLHVPGTGLFWRVSYDGLGGGPGALELVDLDGEPVGPTIELPVNAYPYLVDPASGGVVVTAAGRQYVVTPDAVEPLATGEIVGLSDELVVAYDCDDALSCSLYRTDRTTGARTPIPDDPDLAEPYQWVSMASWGGGRADTLSPDGRWVAVIGQSWRSSVAGIVELETGRFVELSPLDAQPTVAWSPDGRWAFTLDAQVVTAYDTISGERFPVFTDRVGWIQLADRPVAVPEPAANGPTLLSASPEESIEG